MHNMHANAMATYEQWQPQTQGYSFQVIKEIVLFLCNLTCVFMFLQREGSDTCKT